MLDQVFHEMNKTSFSKKKKVSIRTTQEEDALSALSAHSLTNSLAPVELSPEELIQLRFYIEKLI